MYPVSKATLAQLGPNGQNRRIDWYGTMVTESGVRHEITTDIIDSGSIKQVSSLPFVGGAYSGSLQCQLKMRDVDARTLKNARIEIFTRVYCVDWYAPPASQISAFGISFFRYLSTSSLLVVFVAM